MSDKRFDTTDKRLNFIAAGNIITFKNGNQLAIEKVHYNKETSKTFLIGFSDTMKFKSMSELIDKIDWDWMEENCIFKDYSNL